MLNNTALVGFIFNRTDHWTCAVPSLPGLPGYSIGKILYLDSMKAGPVPLNTVEFGPRFQSVWAVII